MANRIETLSEDRAIRTIVECIYDLSSAKLTDGAAAAASRFLGDNAAKSIRGNTDTQLRKIAQRLGDNDIYSIESAISSIAGSIGTLVEVTGKNYGWLLDLIGQRRLPDSLPEGIEPRHREIYEIAIHDLNEGL